MTEKSYDYEQKIFHWKEDIPETNGMSFFFVVRLFPMSKQATISSWLLRHMFNNHIHILCVISTPTGVSCFVYEIEIDHSGSIWGHSEHSHKKEIVWKQTIAYCFMLLCAYFARPRPPILHRISTWRKI